MVLHSFTTSCMFTALPAWIPPWFLQPWVDIVALAVSLSQMLGMLVYVGTMALSGDAVLAASGV